MTAVFELIEGHLGGTPIVTDLGNTTVRLGSITGLTSHADQGAISTSSIDIDDPSGTWDIEPFRQFAMYELAGGTNRVFTGYTTERTYQRADSLLTGPARRISIGIADLNSLFFNHVITHGMTYKRPVETDIERLDWLLSQVLLGVYDDGLVDRSNPYTMSAVDYSGQFAIDVMNDIAPHSRKNFFITWDDTNNHASLAFFKSNSSSYFLSTLSISNVLTDLSSTCFAPIAPSLNRDPSESYSGVWLPYSGGVVYVTQAGRDIPRDVVAPSANTSSKTVATNKANAFLAASQIERETVTCTLKVPAAQAHLIKAGMLVNARFTDFPDWDPGIDVRVLELSLKQDEQSDEFYNIGVTIGHPLIVDFAFGGLPENEKVWPSQQPPFVPSGVGSIVYVQSAKTADGSADGNATLGATPTAGDFLVAVTEPDQPGAPVAAWAADFPTGWTTDAFGDLTGLGHAIASKISDASETSTDVDWRPVSSSPASPNGIIIVSEYDVDGAIPTLLSTSGPVLQDVGVGTTTLPAISLPAGSTALIVWLVGFHPNYAPTVSAGWNIRQSWDSTGGSRLRLLLVDRIVTNATGTYSGTLTSPGGTDNTGWVLMSAVYGVGTESPSIGQPVAPESATADGSRVIYTTNYPYVPGSLVVKVNGVITQVDETDPTTGVFTLPAPPASGASITWTYNVADPAPTGANNPPPGTSGGSVPPDPGTMPGGDGINRQPLAPFVPAETPNGVITVFTIVPYVAGTTLVYINGLIQRIGVDYTESSPGTGAITFTTAPWTGADITVAAMPYHAVSTGPRPFPAPVTSGTFVIPGTIDDTGATDVVAAMNAWIASVPDGSILQFGGGTFQMSQGIQLSNRHNLELDGQGATIVVSAGSSGASQLSSQIITGHAYGGSFSLGATDIAIHDFILVGNNPSPGEFTPGTEAAANLELTGCTRLEVYNITGSAAWGDFIFVEDITNGWFHDNIGTDAGRNGISVISGNTILCETTSFTTCGYNTLDVEPNDSSQACINVTIRDCTAGTWGNAYLGVEGSHTGAPIHGVIISGNSITTDSLLTIVDNGGTSRMTNIAFTNNTSAGGSVAGPVLQFSHVDNVTVTGNVQTHSGALTSFTDCTGVVT